MLLVDVIIQILKSQGADTARIQECFENPTDIIGYEEIEALVAGIDNLYDNCSVKSDGVRIYNNMEFFGDLSVIIGVLVQLLAESEKAQ